MSNWLQQYVYRTHISWWIYGATAGIVVFIALFIICIQAIRAAMANPVKSLRSE
jgi:ABC-type antimicrobial peptide transport system permease subunit